MTRLSPAVRLRALAPLCGLVLLALALRLWRLADPSLWWDEGVSVYLAHAGLPALTVTKDFSVDLHAPGYHLLLGFWSLILGPSVFSGRLLSVFCGVLTVPLTFSLVRGLTAKVGEGGTEAAILAALLAAASPIDLYYSQEIRMYALLPVVGLFGLLATQRVLRDNSRASWALWALANAVGWYCYYYLALLTLAEAVVVLLAAPQSWRRWLGASAGLALSYVPWALIVQSRIRGSALALPPETEVHLTAARFLAETGQAFTVGFSTPPGTTLLLALWGILAAIGLGWLARRQPFGALLLVLSVAVPLVGAAAVLEVRPFYYPRFIIFGAVPIWALVALGACALRGRWLWLALVPILVGSFWTWHDERTTPRTGYAPDDYRVVFQTLAAAARPGDVVVGGYPWQTGYVEAYLGTQGVRGVFLSSPDVGATADAVLGGAPRAWVYSYSPDHSFGGDKLADAFAARRQTYFVDQFGDTRLRLFGQATAALPAVRAGQARLGPSIELASGVVPAGVVLRPGDSLPVILRWQAIATPAADYTVFVHLLGPDGKVWGQKDSPPLGGAFPTSGWRAGEVLVDRYAIPLDGAAPTGHYQVEIGMYLPSTGERLPVDNGTAPDNRVVLATVEVVR